MIVALDTSVAVDLLRGRRPDGAEALDRARRSGHQACLPSLVAHELIAGALLSAQPHRRMREVEALLGEIPDADFTTTDAQSSAAVLVRLQKAGRRIGVVDTLIGGQALARGWTLMTGNVRHFAQIDGLQVIEWADLGPFA